MTSEETKTENKTPLTMKLVRAAENSANATLYLINAIQLDPERASKALELIKSYVEIEIDLRNINKEAYKMKRNWVEQFNKENEKEKVTELPAQDVESIETGDQKEAI